MSVTNDLQTRSAGEVPAAARFRPEIHALRTLAVAGVVLFHLWPNRVTGGYIGVDVFFVISGYLITSHLLREVEKTGTIRLSSFYARRIRRLLPAAMLVLFLTAIGTLYLSPEGLVPGYLFQITASALYFVNWVLAFNSTDYFAATGPESPVQHYWSLSVEEQFYLIWPLVFIGVAAIAIRRSLRTRGPLAIAVGGVFILSIVFSGVVTIQAQQAAYFNTLAHAWEFAAGGLLGLAQSRLDASRWSQLRHTRAALLWTGLFTIAATMLMFNATTPVPGWVAVIPVGGTLAVIAGGVSGVRWSPSPLLGWRPVQFVGDVSYSMYLWHWPLIVLAPFLLHRQLAFWDKIIILILTIFLSWMTRAFVEQTALRGRLWKRRRFSYGFAIGSALLIIAICAIPMWSIQQRGTAAQQSLVQRIVAGDPCVGAPALRDVGGCGSTALAVDPDLAPSAADTDYESFAEATAAELGTSGSCDSGANGSDVCTFGDAEGASSRIALVGDSHAEHLLPALAVQAGEEPWSVEAHVKRSCPFVVSDWRASGASEYKQNDAGCIAWRESIVDQIAQDSTIDVVVVTTYGHRVGIDGSANEQAEFTAALGQTWRMLTDAGKQVIVVADTPVAIGNDIIECLDEVNSAVECANARGGALPPDPLQNSVPSTDTSGLSLLDLTDAFCDDSKCYAAIGGLRVYEDSHHITPAFSASLAQRFTDAVKKAIQH